MSERQQNGFGIHDATREGDAHGKFRRLAALATAGELTDSERRRLERHVTSCAVCREVLADYERIARDAMPALARERYVEAETAGERGCWSLDAAEAALMESLQAEPAVPPRERKPAAQTWRLLSWWTTAAAAMLLVAVGYGSYRFGTENGQRSDRASNQVAPRAQARTAQALNLPELAAPATSPGVVVSDRQIARAHPQAAIDPAELARLRERVSRLEAELAEGGAALEQSRNERENLNRQLTEAEANLQGLQGRLQILSGQSAQDSAETDALKARVHELTGALDAKDQEIGREQALLDRDRDIRNLIGARNLYIAEIYDVAKNGDTEKPFGRVFYTKDKSLVFYGYDLDRQKGTRKETAFQAWGRQGTDGQHTISLGLLAPDDAHQKRWVLKVDDPRTIGQMDAIFVTAEPEGGSLKPTGKPLLFTYLRLDPNHP